jgi:hypothetical protein
MKVQLLVSFILFVVWLYTLVDVISTPGGAMRNLPKVAWVIVVLAFPVLGTVAWFALGRPEGRPAHPLGAYERSAPAFPEYDRPGRAAAVDPEKDEEFLRQIKARAEQQRLRHEQQKKREEQNPDATS